MIIRRSPEVGISGVGPHCQATELVSVPGLYSHYGYLRCAAPPGIISSHSKKEVEGERGWTQGRKLAQSRLPFHQ